MISPMTAEVLANLNQVIVSERIGTSRHNNPAMRWIPFSPVLPGFTRFVNYTVPVVINIL